MIKGFIFDVDGTLLDSMNAWKDVGGVYLEKLGLTPEEELSEKLFSLSLFDSADYIIKTYGIENTRDGVIAEIVAIIRDKYFYNIPLKSGVREFLEVAGGENIPMVAATTSEKELIEGAFKRLNIRHFFKDIITCADVGVGKDRPDIYLRAADCLQLDKSCCLVFEDALYAAKTAVNAGFKVVGVYDEESKKHEKELRTVCSRYVYHLQELF